eukprot:COSAG05_NODE_955_length_6434_cov_15.147119_1_plen_40_part_10
MGRYLAMTAHAIPTEEAVACGLLTHPLAGTATLRHVLSHV